MRERIAILQAQFLYHSLHLPQDTLLSKLLPFLQTSSSISQWYKLTKSPLWRTFAPSTDTMDTRTFKHLRQTFLQNNLESRCDGPSSKLLSACQPTLNVDPILWLCTIRMITFPSHMHQRLFLPISIEDPLPFLLNLLPTTKPRQSSKASF
ncbi:MAG: hypothetical protein EXX96DRAFT_255690 [Benjaminiella poitrasii]|nr:MAG: hypothetical protein EXX96DRAFT_255690 [Benjaminiella poitrasii]